MSSVTLRILREAERLHCLPPVGKRKSMSLDERWQDRKSLILSNISP